MLREYGLRSTILIVFALLVLVGSAGCGAGRQAGGVPELLEPVSVRDNTAIAGRGNVERVERYTGIVRMRSEELSFGLAYLRFGEYYVIIGERVTKGQLLAKLDTEIIERQFEAQQEYVARLAEDFEYENRLAEIDIAIAQAELAAMNSALSLSNAQTDYSGGATNPIGAKSYEIARLRLQSEQAREIQALTLRYAQEQLEELRQQLSDAELRAPYDGVVTWMAVRNRGDYVASYDGLVFISDEKDIFVELTEERIMTETQSNDLIVGQAGSDIYELEWVPLDSQESLYYRMNFILPPARFGAKSPDAELTPGMYVSVLIYDSIAYDVLRVPLSSVYTDLAAGTYVYVIENGIKVMRPFEQGLRGDLYVEVISGLEEGDEVFVRS